MLSTILLFTLVSALLGVTSGLTPENTSLKTVSNDNVKVQWCFDSLDHDSVSPHNKHVDYVISVKGQEISFIDKKRNEEEGILHSVIQCTETIMPFEELKQLKFGVKVLESQNVIVDSSHALMWPDMKMQGGGYKSVEVVKNNYKDTVGVSFRWSKAEN
jgi:hypothetical protein